MRRSFRGKGNEWLLRRKRAAPPLRREHGDLLGEPLHGAAAGTKDAEKSLGFPQEETQLQDLRPWLQQVLLAQELSQRVELIELRFSAQPLHVQKISRQRDLQGPQEVQDVSEQCSVPVHEKLPVHQLKFLVVFAQHPRQPGLGEPPQGGRPGYKPHTSHAQGDHLPIAHRRLSPSGIIRMLCSLLLQLDLS